MYLAVDVNAASQRTPLKWIAIVSFFPDLLQDVADGGEGIHEEREEAEALLGVEECRLLRGHKAVPVKAVLHEPELVLLGARVALYLRPLIHDARDLSLDAGGRETADQSKMRVEGNVGDEVGRPRDLAESQRGDARHEESATAIVRLDGAQDAPQYVASECCVDVV